MNKSQQTIKRAYNYNIEELDINLIKIKVLGKVTVADFVQIKSDLASKRNLESKTYILLDLSDFVSLDFNSRRWVYESKFLPMGGYEVIIFGIPKGKRAELHFLYNNNNKIAIHEEENEQQAKYRVKELMDESKMDSLAVGPSTFTGVIKDKVSIKGKDFIMLHDKSWSYQNPGNSYYYRIDLLDANVFVSRPAGYIEYDNSITANILFDKVVFKTLGHEKTYYRIQDYSEVINTSLSARRDFTNYIINNINRIDIMVFYGLNAFMKAIVKFGKLIHPKFYKVKIADNFEESLEIIFKHKYGKDFFKNNNEQFEYTESSKDQLSELISLREENKELRKAYEEEKKSILKAIGEVLWKEGYTMEGIPKDIDSKYAEVYNALKILQVDLKEIYDKKESTISSLVGQTKVLSEELKWCKKKHESNNATKIEFFNELKFQINSPFQSILSNVELLKRTSKEEVNSQNIKQLEESCFLLKKRLSHADIWHDGLRFQKNNKLIVFNLEATIYSIIRAAHQNAFLKGIELSYQGDENLPKYLIGDEDKIRMIIDELVNNAIQSTENGYVLVRTIVIDGDDESVRLKIEVEDSGIGLSSKNLEYLINDSNGENEDNKLEWNSIGGGFLILKQLSEIIDAKIDVESKEHVGTKFTVEMELNRGVFSKEMNLKKPQLNIQLKSKKLSGRRILYFLSNTMQENVYHNQLNEMGLTVEFANDIQTFSNFLNNSHFDYIIIDDCKIEDELPILLKYIANKEDDKEEPHVINISSYPSENIEELIMNHSIDATLIKPFHMVELKKLLESL